jgi:GSH-dependent disulfide-bond oxidoreductase
VIDLYFWRTPNGQKIAIALEELELPYRVFPVNIGRGEQFRPEFLAISRNNRIPAIVDHEPKGGGAPISLFESGAILLYLAEKTGRLLPADIRGRAETIQWLMWQMGGVGPMFGQANHFVLYAREQIPYAIERYVTESKRLLGVMNARLADREFLAGTYSVADVACFPWVLSAFERLGLESPDFSQVKRWVETIRARPAVVRGLAVGKQIPTLTMDDEARKHLFGEKRAK